MTKKEAEKILGVGKQALLVTIETDYEPIHEVIFFNFKSLKEAKQKHNQHIIDRAVNELLKSYDCDESHIIDLMHMYSTRGKSISFHMGEYYAHEYDKWIDCVVFNFIFFNSPSVVKVLDDNYSVADGVWQGQDNGCGDYFEIYGEQLK